VIVGADKHGWNEMLMRMGLKDMIDIDKLFYEHRESNGRCLVCKDGPARVTWPCSLYTAAVELRDRRDRRDRYLG
jgi:hypothetical protein